MSRDLRAALEAQEWERQSAILTPNVGDDWVDVSDLHQARCDGVMTPNEHERYDCERPLGHFGEHVASLRSYVVATWDNRGRTARGPIPPEDVAVSADLPPAGVPVRPFSMGEATDALRQLHEQLTAALASAEAWSTERADLVEQLGKAQHDLNTAVQTLRTQAERIAELEQEINEAQRG